jgi:hypothetical protein
MPYSRRIFLQATAMAAAVAVAYPRLQKLIAKEPLLYPPMDLSYFDIPIAPDRNEGDTVLINFTETQHYSLRKERA